MKLCLLEGFKKRPIALTLREILFLTEETLSPAPVAEEHAPNVVRSIGSTTLLIRMPLMAWARGSIYSSRPECLAITRRVHANKGDEEQDAGRRQVRRGCVGVLQGPSVRPHESARKRYYDMV